MKKQSAKRCEKMVKTMILSETQVNNLSNNPTDTQKRQENPVYT